MISNDDFRIIAEGYNVSDAENGVLHYIQFYKSSRSICGTMLDLQEEIVEAEHIYPPVAVYQPKETQYLTNAQIAQKWGFRSSTHDLIDMPSVY